VPCFVLLLARGLDASDKLQKPNSEAMQMGKDGKTGSWLCGISLFAWLFGAASFGVTGGNIVIVIIANLGFILGPFAFIFGVYLLVKSEIMRWLNRR
jgi:hypothetical protein